VGGVTAIGGALLGSVVGGLFDSHKKAVNANTLATERNTAVMEQLLFAPSGFKVESYRYSASDVKKMYDAVAQEAVTRSRRGGAQILAVNR